MSDPGAGQVKSVDIRVSEHAGFCWGVERALEIARRAAEALRAALPLVADRRQRRGRHAYAARSDGGALRFRLAADIDHAGIAVTVDMGQFTQHRSPRHQATCA